ncbi:SPW repeat domain-containing protein [Rubellimicrobium roseum]|uniref:SPW repeat-containing integral membrane domain-containing protein n=1 Tax=Rubellimicrobium roseum TaxID=687525 RepID=A0A5C4N929_9RHOB|nr:hypothetical protein [Rubellimicrobium roseum]TNC65811.1 hypothetical protein FHG71_17350 [Rubellimicrobium roseum]
MKKLLLDPRMPGALALGAAVPLLLSPPVLGFADTAATSAFVLAALIAVIGARTFARPAAWEGWIIAAVGLMTFAMPWIMGFGAVAMAVLAHKAVGVVLLAAGALALWEGRRTDKDANAGIGPTPYEGKGSADVG